MDSNQKIPPFSFNKPDADLSQKEQEDLKLLSRIKKELTKARANTSQGNRVSQRHFCNTSEAAIS